MRIKTHFFAGLFLAIVFLRVFTLPVRVELQVLIFAILGAVIQDFDFAVAWIAPKSWLLRHRGMSHSVYPLALLTLLLLIFFSWPVALIFALSFLLHLILDSFTYKGVDYFGTGKRVKGKVRYNALINHLLALLFLALSILLLIGPILAFFLF